jgi:epoxyqueuosine reductase
MLTGAAIKASARTLGFDVCGIAPAASFPELRYLREWLAAGYAGEMSYLQRSADRRADVRAVLPSARSVVVLGTLYNVARPYSTELRDPGIARIARYAWGDDYHEVLTRRLDALLSWMRDAHPDPFEARAYVDTGPVQERVYAQYAGVGWIGKNTCLINKTWGSWLFLSEIISDLPLLPDAPALDHCGECTLCIEACPTQALREARVLDSTRCISYLTIELKGQMPGPLRAPAGAHVHGCDICQEVCPWNGASPVSLDPAWQPRPAFDQPRLSHLADRSDDDLRQAMKGSAMKRAGVRGLRRNLEVALANLGEERVP